MRLSVSQPALEELQMDSFLRVGMRETLEQFAHRNLNAQFFTQLAGQALLESLALLALAAGKFP